MIFSVSCHAEKPLKYNPTPAIFNGYKTHMSYRHHSETAHFVPVAITGHILSLPLVLRP
ncbi:Uncharacterised protein [Serratia fonticola]|jgi:hypothetical protein|nr:Uncharacterised protein [Serratia fonticola]